MTYCLNNVELWKHGFSSPLCQILKSLLIEILEIMITIRKKKEKPKVRLQSKFHKNPSKTFHWSITDPILFFLFLRRLHLRGLDLRRLSLLVKYLKVLKRFKCKGSIINEFINVESDIFISFLKWSSQNAENYLFIKLKMRNKVSLSIQLTVVKWNPSSSFH